MNGNLIRRTPWLLDVRKGLSYSLGKLIEWKLKVSSELSSNVILSYSLGKLIEWKL